MKTILAFCLKSLIKFYRLALSPLKPKTCRYYPSCSLYAIDAIEKYGPFKGLYKAMNRILRCHPFHPGGFDPVL